jgi:hypothetical protein
MFVEASAFLAEIHGCFDPDFAFLSRVDYGFVSRRPAGQKGLEMRLFGYSVVYIYVDFRCIMYLAIRLF